MTTADDITELTDDEAFEVRRVAVVLGWKLGEGGLARALHSIADDYDAPRPCEACAARATCSDEDGVPLCDACAEACALKSEAP